MADKRNRTPFYGAVPTSKLNADHVFMADGSTLQEQADKKFELIEEITLTEDTVSIVRTTEPDTTPYNFSALYISMNFKTAASAGNCLITVKTTANESIVNYGIGSALSDTQERYSSMLLTKIYNNLYFTTMSTFLSSGGGTSTAYTKTIMNISTNNINNISISTTNTAFPTDSVIRIYAIRA